MALRQVVSWASPYLRRGAVLFTVGCLCAALATEAVAAGTSGVVGAPDRPAADPLPGPVAGMSVRQGFGFPVRRSAAGEVVMLGDLSPGAASSHPSELRRAHGRVFFVAGDRVHGREPWVSDGTPQGTVMLGDMEPGPIGSAPRAFTPAARGVVFLTDTRESDPNGPLIGHMWSTDGTGTGGDIGTTTLLVSGPTLGPIEGAPLNGNALMMTSNFEDDARLWRSDGTKSGTALVKARLILGSGLTPVGGFAFFTDAQNPLWRTDGTPAGTRKVRGWPDGPNGSTFVFHLTAVARRAFFTVDSLFRVGTELWVSDGTRAGTRLVKDIRPGPARSNPASFAALGRTLYFVASDGRHGRQLWRSDGTAPGTVRVTNLSHSRNSPQIGHVTTCEGSVYFTANGRGGRELWVSNGRSGSAHRVADLAPGPRGSTPSRLTCIKGGLAFSADDGRNGRELWTVSGPRATPVLQDLSPAGASHPSRLIRVGSNLYFSANDGNHGREPWVLRR